MRQLASALLLAAPALLASPEGRRAAPTTRADVVEALGTPLVVVEHYDLDGEIVLFPEAGTTEQIDEAFARRRQEGRRRRVVRYDFHAFCAEPDYWVFAEGSETLAYAILEPSSSESTLDRAIRRYGRTPIVTRVQHRDGNAYRKATHYEFPEDGVILVAFAEHGRIDRKLLVPPRPFPRKAP